MPTDQVLFSNGIAIDFQHHKDQFLGIGAVLADGIALRNPQRPMFVEIRNPWGVELVDYRLKTSTRNSSEARLSFTAAQRQNGIMEWMLHSVRNRYVTADWTAPNAPATGTSLELILRPIERQLGNRRFIGFSYQYEYHSNDIPIYKILDRSTWEPSGTAVGSEFWMRNCFVPSIVSFKNEQQFYSSEWYLSAATNPSIFQFLPLQTELQGFTFTSGLAGTLLTWATRVAHIRSLFEKPRQSTQLVHMHEHCGDLVENFTTSPVEVLWHPGMLDHVERLNTYEDAREMVHEALHSQIGMKRHRVSTYGMIEEWGPADLNRYRTLGASKLIEVGVRKIGLANHCRNNMNVWGVSNMCCTVDYKIADSVGSNNLQAFCDTAKAADVKVEMWANTALSVLTELFRRHDDHAQRIRFLPKEDSVGEALDQAAAPYVRNPSNAIEADHYTPSFAVLNLRDPVIRDYWIHCWTQLHNQIGLQGIFLDSSFNLSSDKFHWVQNATDQSLAGATADQTALLGHYRPEMEPPSAIHSQYLAHLELMTQMQRIGFDYCNEDLGVFGIHRHGPSCDKRITSLPIWSDCLTEFDPSAIAAAGQDPYDLFFRGLAYRMMWVIHWDIKSDSLSFHYGSVRNPEDVPGPMYLKLLKVFNRVEPHMHHRKILAGESAVAYTSSHQMILWMFADVEIPLHNATRITDVLAESTLQVNCLHAQKHHIYELPPNAIDWDKA